MTAAQRARLLRERFRPAPILKAQPGAGMARGGKPAHDRKRVRYVVLPKPAGRGFVSCGPLQAREAPAWVATPDDHDKPALRLKRRQVAPVLVKVALKAKRAKLPRLQLREPWQIANVAP